MGKVILLLNKLTRNHSRVIQLVVEELIEFVVVHSVQLFEAIQGEQVEPDLSLQLHQFRLVALDEQVILYEGLHRGVVEVAHQKVALKDLVLQVLDEHSP